MSTNFEIIYNGNAAMVHRSPMNEKQETHYHIHIKDEVLTIYKKEDNEGAVFWFDIKENITTDESTKIGELIIEVEKNI